MKSKILLGLFAVGLALGTTAAGCGDDTSATGGAGGEGGDATTKASSTSGVVVSSTSSTGTGMGDGNDTIGMATPMEEMDGISFYEDGELDPPDTDIDFLSFNGVAGPVLIFADAKPDNDEFADGYVDVVISLYDTNQQLVARNDDPFPRFSQDSQLYTILPSDGTYYLEVEEFCEFSEVDLGQACPDASTYFGNLNELAYAVYVVPLDPMENSTVAEGPEPNHDDVVGMTTLMEYEPNPNGNYYASIAYGDFQTAADVDGIRFTLPSDITLDPGTRLNGNFTIQPSGTDEGNGSDRNAGIVRVVIPGTGEVVAEFDMSTRTGSPDRADISAPLLPGVQYLFTVAEGPAAAGSLGSFYFITHSTGGGNPVETQELANNMAATPEILTASPGTQSFFIEGDLDLGDTDHFQVNVFPGDLLTVVCGAQRSGSGVRGLTASVRTTAGVELMSGSETPAAQLLIEDVDPGAEANLVVRLTKTSQDAVVEGTYYRCGFHFNPPTP
jgi:hypothetical protein